MDYRLKTGWIHIKVTGSKFIVIVPHWKAPWVAFFLLVDRKKRRATMKKMAFYFCVLLGAANALSIGEKSHDYDTVLDPMKFFIHAFLCHFLRFFCQIYESTL